MAGIAVVAASYGGCAGSTTADDVNVLLVTLDTTRADYLGAYGNRQVATPHLDGLARDGVLFTRATTSVPLTLPAHASLMTGSWPMDHGVRDNGGFFLHDEQVTLAELLRADGLATFGAVGSFILHHGWGVAQGFDSFDDRFETSGGRPANRLNAQRDGARVVSAVLDWWEAHPESRFFVWAHLYDPHYPYEAPEEFARRYPGDPYAGEIAYTDDLVGRLLAYLREHELYDSTLIVVVGDHGEGLDEHGEPDHGIFLYDSTLRVPLIIRAPGTRQRGNVERLARLVDVMPTVLDLLGLSIPAGLRGRSLLDAMNGAGDDEILAYAEARYARYHYGWSELRSMRDDRFKYIDAPRPELYDLREDPAELLNLVDTHAELAAEFKAELDHLIASTGDAAAGATDQDEAELDPETLERLRSLGYVGSVVRSPAGQLPDPKDRTGSLTLLSKTAQWVRIHIQAERFDEAVREVDRALETEPNYLDGYLLKGEALRMSGRPEPAIEALERGLELSPDDPVINHELALCYMALHDWQVALGLLQQLHSTSPRDSKASFSLADVYTELGRTADAVDVLEGLLGVYPESAITQYEIGRAYLKLGDSARARERIERALELQPRIFGAHYNLALIAEAEDDPERAEVEYREEVEQFPADHEAWTNLGILSMGLGKPERAEEAFTKVIELRPQLSLGYYLLARTLAETGRAGPETLELARRAVELDPSSERARELLRRLGS
jgi:arylsulfatase A-like enzyme/Flp pilus assembly protein TadD